MKSILDIRVRAVTMTVSNLTLYRAGLPIVEDLSFTAGPGDAVVLRGPNGSGKTTLLRALAGLLRPQGGSIRFAQEHDKVDVAAGAAFASLISTEDAVAYIGHGDGLAPGETAREHVRFHSRWFRGDTDVSGSLAALGAAGFADLPSRRLSAGQRRRAALARVVASKKPIWLLDEPAAPLDTDGRILLDEVIGRRRRAGGIIIAAAHDTLGWTETRTLQFTRIMPGLELNQQGNGAAEPDASDGEDDDPGDDGDAPENTGAEDRNDLSQGGGA